MTAQSLPPAAPAPHANAPVRYDERPRTSPDWAADGRPAEVMVVWEGDIDVASAPVLAAGLGVLSDVGVRTVLIDVAGVEFMDCAGLGLLLEADNRLDHGLVLVRPSRPVKRLLALVELMDHFSTTEMSVPTTSVPDAGVTIEQSRGLIMGSYGCTADQASKILLSTALRQNVQVNVLAALLVTVTSGDLDHGDGGPARAVQRVMGSAVAAV